MKQKLTVGLQERSYDIHVGAELLGQAELLLAHVPRKRVAIVTNTTVAPLYLERLVNTLRSVGISSIAVILPDGESYKTSATLNLIYDALLENRCERSTPLIALGGGVIGDMTGFAAATYLRGVPFIQIPTTLLSQVDSSVGGKTGINHPLGKNMIGAFYQPQLVLADISTLNTLPDRELSTGLAEVIKYGLIRDLPFLVWLEQNIQALLAREPAALQYAIVRSCSNKAEVVGVDERESGERALLNLGHTFGHAVESASRFRLLHGEAVGFGLACAADLASAEGLLQPRGHAEMARLRGLLAALGLPLRLKGLALPMVMRAMAQDKKFEGEARFVLPRRLGLSVLHPLKSLASARAVLAARLD